MKVKLLLITLILFLITFASLSNIKEPIKIDKYEKIRIQALEFEKKELYYDAYLLYSSKIYPYEKDQDSIDKMLLYTEKLGLNIEFEKVIENAMLVFPNNLEYHEKALKYYSKFPNSRINSLLKTVSKKFPNYKSEILNQSQFKYSIHGTRYDEIKDFNGNYAVFLKDKKYGIIDQNLSIVRHELEYVGGYSTEEKVFPVLKNKEWLYIDLNGYKRKHSDIHYDELGVISDGYTYAKKNEKYGYLDKDLNEKSNFEYDNAGTFYKGIAPVSKNEKWALIDKEFKEVTSFEYDEILMDSNKIANRYGVIFARKNKEWVLINQKGERLSKDTLLEAHSFISNKPAAVKTEKGWTFIDIEGNLFGDIYDETYSYQNNKSFIRKDGKYYFINLKGEISSELPFKKVSEIGKNGFAKVVIDEKGNSEYISTYIEKEE